MVKGSVCPAILMLRHFKRLFAFNLFLGLWCQSKGCLDPSLVARKALIWSSSLHRSSRNKYWTDGILFHWTADSIALHLNFNPARLSRWQHIKTASVCACMKVEAARKGVAKIYSAPGNHQKSKASTKNKFNCEMDIHRLHAVVQIAHSVHVPLKLRPIVSIVDQIPIRVMIWLSREQLVMSSFSKFKKRRHN